MNDVIDLGQTGPKSAAELAGLKNVTMVIYALQALSFMFGLTAVVGLIVNYIKREDVRGTIYESHFNWQIRTFWWGLLWAMVGVILAFVLVGFAIMFVAWIWVIYRVIKGWLKLTEDKPVYPA